MHGLSDVLRAVAAVIAALALLPITPAWSAEACHVVASNKPNVHPAAFAPTALNDDEVRLTFVGHATFLIESPHGVRIATDYNGSVRPEIVPDVITMNHAHPTHYTDRPDPTIKHVLRGWDPDGGVARHDLQVEDVHIRNVPTNIRDWPGGTEFGGNSIFVFEVADLCIAHLGHLHHPLTPEHLRDLGPIDVVLAPVDGSWTMSLDGMMEVLAAIHAPLVVPMHYFSEFTLDRFLARARERYAVERNGASLIALSRATLPAKPTVLVLPAQWGE